MKQAIIIVGVLCLAACSQEVPSPPAPAPVPARPILDSEYAFALTVLFDDLAGHGAYQTHPTHLKFVADHKDCWTRIAVFDAA